MTRRRRPRVSATCLVALGALPLAACDAPPAEPAGTVLRVATYNVEELSAAKLAETDERGRGTHAQLLAAARVIRALRPDVLVLNEVDHHAGGEGDSGRYVEQFAKGYLETGDDPLSYPYVFVAPSNTGVLTGLDVNGDGVVATEADVGTRPYGDDSFGFGTYPGQYAMAVLSRVPLDADGARTFQRFLWRDLPGHHMPGGFYDAGAERVLRLSSKSHWDVPVLPSGPDGPRLHLWVSHPTPPVFDGPEDRNGRRNFDEIGFWRRYLDGSEALYDDRGRHGGYGSDEPFVVLGDLNADPSGGEARLGDTTAVSQLLSHPRIRDPEPLAGRPTAEFGGGMRVDYVLPSAELEVVAGGVWWPSAAEDPDGAATAERASDHRLVWLDLRVPGG